MKTKKCISATAVTCIAFIVSVVHIPIALAVEDNNCIIKQISEQTELLSETAQESFSLKMKDGVISRAEEPLSPTFPEVIKITNSNSVAIELNSWPDKIFSINSDGTAGYVANSDGSLVGALDNPYVQTLDGQVFPAKLEIREGKLIASTEKVSSGNIHMNYLNTSGDKNLSLPSFERESFIGVPSGYVYNPSLGWAHDYCTKSPDEFNVAGNRADFRGPCARHDMCYQRKRCRSKSCDVALRENLKTNCRVQLGGNNPLRGTCLATADTYYNVVTLVQNASFWDNMPRCD